MCCGGGKRHLQQSTARWAQCPEALPKFEPCSMANLEVGLREALRELGWKWSNSLTVCELQHPMLLHPLHNIHALFFEPETKPE